MLTRKSKLIIGILAPRSVVAVAAVDSAEIDLAEGSPSSATCSVRRLVVGCYVGGGGEIGGVPPWRIGSACPSPRRPHPRSPNKLQIREVQ